MSDNIRIKATPGGGEKSVNIDINQKFDFIEILSLKISQEEAYRRFCSDYGVVVGRVIVNNGVGVPNAKVSIFIPADEVDLEDPELAGLYPFETITDTDSEGIPYNLLPRNNRGKDECFTPIGTFPSKREIQDNPLIGDLYCKYYKFTTTTNESGDFMFFGVPVGTHFMHVNADISDIGFLSQRPYDIIRDGANETSFKSPTKFKGRSETGSLTQLKTFSPMSITVPPFWGDTEQCRIGIARSDVNLATNITPSAIFMGSIVSDNDKHALSRTCRPRKKLGKMDELVTGDGRIEMIRKTANGGIERFDLQDAEIDEDGVWAYQIPMNRDYMITAEDGTLVPSGDPTKGVPTTARVRFRIGMTINGDEGRFRTRAKYLVPHNPDKWSEADFSFGTSTSDNNFSDLSWNKIYTVKNYIPRVQPNRNVENRNFIGFKNVDDSKNRNPIPYNKLDNDLNPLFGILCLLIRIIARLVGVLNSVLIPILNTIMALLNGILFVICATIKNIGRLICSFPDWLVGKGCDKRFCIGSNRDSINKIGDCKCDEIVPYIPYITLGCSANPDNLEYAPGGRKGLGNLDPRTLSWNATFYQDDGTTKSFRYVNDGGLGSECGDLVYPGPGGVTTVPPAIPIPPFHQLLTIEGCDAGWSDCQSAALADALDVFKYDFYNDWINGTLYPFLLKYKIKKRGRGRERFCEVDCDEWPGEGVDNDKKNGSDNPCKRNYILDTCTGANPQGKGATTLFGYSIWDRGVNTKETIKTRSGYIKKYENELYYAPITREGDNKLFATDIVSLGSVFECDWEGVPQFYNYLDDTTFNIPPLLPELIINSDGTFGDPEVSGMLSGEPLKPGLIGDLSCFRFNTNENSCNNLKRLCELGVGLDERRIDSTVTPEVVYPTDNLITNIDVESDVIRGIFARLNTPGTTTVNEIFFDKLVYPDYQNTPYSNFRVNGGIVSTNTSFYSKNIWVFDNSFYFYFGLNKGASALSKMKRKYFTECTPEPETDFYVVAIDITADGNAPSADGAIDIEVIGGVGPYTYNWTGPSGYAVTNTTGDISGLLGGTYNVEVIDSVGNVTSATFNVPGPPAVSCQANGTDLTGFNSGDGEIMVDINSGVNPYTVELSGNTLTSPITQSGLVGGTTFSSLDAGTYQVTVTDSGNPQTKCTREIYISEPSALNLTLKTTNVTCPGSNDGSIIATVNGGTGPYTFLWSNGSTNSGINGIDVGTYSVTVTDANGVSTSQTANITGPSKITYNAPIVVNGNCNSSIATITVNNINNGSVPYEVKLEGGENSVTLIETVNTAGGSAIFTNLAQGVGSDEYKLTITDDNGCSVTEFIDVFNPATPITISLTETNFADYNLALSQGNPTPSVSLTATISGGIFNSDPSLGTTYSYRIKLQSSVDGGTTWSDETSVENLGVSTIKTYSITTPVSTPTKYRVVVYDKNNEPDGCTKISAATTTINV